MLARFFKALHITIVLNTPPSQPSSSPIKLTDTLSYIFKEAGLAMHFRNGVIYAGFFPDLLYNIWLDNKDLD